MAAIGLLEADVGKTILWSLVIGVPRWPWPARWRQSGSPTRRGANSRGAMIPQPARGQELSRRPGFYSSVFTILLPVGLMLLATSASLVVPQTSLVRTWLAFADIRSCDARGGGVRLVFLWARLRRTLKQVMRFSEESLGPVAMVLLVVGAAGASASTDSERRGRGRRPVRERADLSPLLLGWLTAALIRVATGSATVAITTAAALSDRSRPLAGHQRRVARRGDGAGSLTLSHVNDGGFWFVKEYLGLTVVQTLKTWTIMETVISLTGLALVLCFSRWF